MRHPRGGKLEANNREMKGSRVHDAHSQPVNLTSWGPKVKGVRSDTITAQALSVDELIPALPPTGDIIKDETPGGQTGAEECTVPRIAACDFLHIPPSMPSAVKRKRPADAHLSDWRLVRAETAGGKGRKRRPHETLRANNKILPEPEVKSW
ncbi:MAG: hypothetical protein A4E57_01255 [Syntrophorhabdaceae bacterium PtaU1.Bin034]|nr:MAG: hypothetical protein A4E57_01255 [Syntrophorhabdaceae bacterium PtaU1.Bin034]